MKLFVAGAHEVQPVAPPLTPLQFVFFSSAVSSANKTDESRSPEAEVEVETNATARELPCSRDCFQPDGACPQMPAGGAGASPS